MRAFLEAQAARSQAAPASGPRAQVTAAAASAPSLADVLANVRKALQYERVSKIPAITIRGISTEGGIPWDSYSTFDNHGRFHGGASSVLGTTAYGFDGTTCWSTNLPHATRRLVLSDRDSMLLNNWLESGYWLTGVVDVTLVAGLTTEKEIVLELSLKTGRYRMQLTIDRAKWLPTRLRADVGGIVETWTYSDYRNSPAGPNPYFTSHETAGVTDTFKVTKIEIAKPDLNALRFKPSQPTNARFDDKLPGALQTAREPVTGCLLVRPRINGKDVGWFVFDTGASELVIDRAVADQLGLETLGKAPIFGVAGTEQTRFRTSKSFQLGRLSRTNNFYAETDMKAEFPSAQERLAGVVGFPVLEAAVVEFQLAPPAVSLHDAKQYKLQKGEWQDLTLLGGLACFRARFEGNREGLFLLDTGSVRTVAFNEFAVRRLDLLKGRRLTFGTSVGVGGRTPIQNGRIDWFEIAGHRFEKPMASFFQHSNLGGLSEDTLGHVGQKLLGAFRVVLNCQEEKIAFQEK
jgi:hypothetical protein